MSRRALAAVAALGLPGWGWALWQATRPAPPTVYVERHYGARGTARTGGRRNAGAAAGAAGPWCEAVERRRGMTITERDRDLLRQMRPGEWYAPLALGGHSRSHHSATLTKLARYGLVERRYRLTPRGPERGSCQYRITPQGEAAQ